MSAILVLEHDGWTVTTSAWTAASMKPDVVSLCYSWSTLSGFAFLDSSTGVERVDLQLSMDRFIDLVKQGRIVDLRRVPRA